MLAKTIRPRGSAAQMAGVKHGQTRNNAAGRIVSLLRSLHARSRVLTSHSSVSMGSSKQVHPLVYTARFCKPRSFKGL